MTQTVIGALLEKHDIIEGVPALNAEIAELDAHIAGLDEQLGNAEDGADLTALEEARATSVQKRARRKARLIAKKDPSYKKAVKLLAKKNAGTQKGKYSIQKDDATGNYIVAKIDLIAAKKARVAAKSRAK